MWFKKLHWLSKTIFKIIPQSVPNCTCLVWHDKVMIRSRISDSFRPIKSQINHFYNFGNKNALGTMLSKFDQSRRYKRHAEWDEIQIDKSIFFKSNPKAFDSFNKRMGTDEWRTSNRFENGLGCCCSTWQGNTCKFTVPLNLIYHPIYNLYNHWNRAKTKSLACHRRNL